MAKEVINKIFILLSDEIDFGGWHYEFESWWAQKPTKEEIEDIICITRTDITDEEYKNLFKGLPVKIEAGGSYYIIREMEPNTIIRTKMYHEDEDRIMLSRNTVENRKHHG